MTREIRPQDEVRKGAIGHNVYVGGPLIAGPPGTPIPPPHPYAGTNLERATRWVLCSEEIVQQLSEDWSEPVEVSISKDDGRILELVLRRHVCGEVAL